MSEISKTNLLRFFLFSVATLALWMAVGIADILHDLALNYISGGSGKYHAVESAVFVFVTSRIIWRWLRRRVWIGEASGAPVGQQRSGS